MERARGNNRKPVFHDSSSILLKALFYRGNGDLLVHQGRFFVTIAARVRHPLPRPHLGHPETLEVYQSPQVVGGDLGDAVAVVRKGKLSAQI